MLPGLMRSILTMIYISYAQQMMANLEPVVSISNHLEYSSHPDIAVDSAGNIYAAWSASSPHGFDIYFSRASVTAYPGVSLSIYLIL